MALTQSLDALRQTIRDETVRKRSMSTREGTEKTAEPPTKKPKIDGTRKLNPAEFNVNTLQLDKIFYGWKNIEKYASLKEIRVWMFNILSEFYEHHTGDDEAIMERKHKMACGPFPKKANNVCIYVNCHIPNCKRNHKCAECAFHLSVEPKDHKSFNESCPLFKDMTEALEEGYGGYFGAN